MPLFFLLAALAVAGCAGYATISPPKQPLPGNKREEKPAGDEYVDAMTSDAKANKKADGRFRVYTLFAPNCQICSSHLEASRELQTTWGNVDVASYKLLSSGAASRGVIPLTILQYGSCNKGIAVSGTLDAQGLIDDLKGLKDACDSNGSIQFSRHLAPIDL